RAAPTRPPPGEPGAGRSCSGPFENARRPGAPGSKGSDQRDAIGFQPFAAVHHVDAYALARPQRSDAAPAQRGYMNENVLPSAVGRYEPVAFIGLEPFARPFERGRRTHRARRCAPVPIPARRPCASTGRHGGAHVDVEDAEHQRAFRTRTHLAGDPGALSHILIAGTPQDRHRQEGVLGSVRECHEAEAFSRVEPLDFALGAAAGLGLIIPEESGAAIVHGASENGLRTVERYVTLMQHASARTAETAP